jgi:mitogen-activated protein kinase 1/3
MWSIGCILAELLTMIRENVPKYNERKPIFPGKVCHTLSPDIISKPSKSGIPYSKND